MPSDTQYLVHIRLTRRDHRDDVLELASTDTVTFAVTAWQQQHPDIAVGAPTVVAEGLDAYAEIPVATAEAAGHLAGFVTWMTEAPAHVHDHDDRTSLPGALTADQLAALIPGSPVEFLLEGTWYPGEVRLTDLTDADSDPMLIVTYTGEQLPNPKIRKGRLDPGDGFPVYAGEIRPPGGAGPPVPPPRPTVHVVRDALIRVYGAAPDTNDASDMYAIEIDGVKILFRLVAADGDTDGEDAPADAEPTVYVYLENVARPKGTPLVVDVNGNANDYPF
jgi:hypothetical protein